MTEGRSQTTAQPAEPRRILFVAAMAVDHLSRLESALPAHLAQGARVEFLASPKQTEVLEYLAAKGAAVTLAPVSRLGFSRLIASLRRSL